MDLRDRCLSIDWLILDVDGVLTDGSIIYGDLGLELKAFHVRDGSGIKFWHQADKRSALISGRQSRVVDRRAKELGIGHVFQDAADKLAVFRQLLESEGLTPQQVCYIGDDLPDLPVLAACGLAVAVADACLEVKGQAHYVTQSAGGCGAVREVIELVLSCQGHWQQVVDNYRNGTR